MTHLNPRRGPALLYRANVSSRPHHADLMVFFESEREKRLATLEHLLHAAWGVDVAQDLVVENVLSEQELLGEWAFGEPSTGDMRLFESGAGPHGVSYVEPWRVQFLVSPPALDRLLLAYWTIPLQPVPGAMAYRDTSWRHFSRRGVPA